MSRVVISPTLGLFTNSWGKIDGSSGPYSQSYSSKVDGGYTFARDDVRKSAFPPGQRPALPYKASVVQNGVITLSYSIRDTGSFPWEYSGFGDYAHKAVFGPPPLPAGVTASLKNEALVRALNNLANLKWNAAVALAEGREAVTMLAKSASTLDSAFQALEKNRYALAARRLGVSSKAVAGVKSAATAWLALQFGWKPLVEDMAQAALALSDVPSRLRLKGASQVRREEVLFSSPSVFFSPDARFSWDLTFKTVNVRETKVSVWYTMSSAQAATLREYGLTNLPLALWAVAPNSFLVDWVLPVSDILSAMQGSFGLTYQSGSCTSFVRAVRTFESAPRPLNGKATLNQFCKVSLPAERMEMSREVYPDDPKPSLTAMYVKDPFDLWKAITALSLLGQRKL